MSSIKIGNVELAHGIALAPLAGVSDRAFRRVCRECGADFSVSEMVSAKALCYEQKSRKVTERSVTGTLASVMKDEMPMAVQLFGSEPQFLAEAARMLESNDYNGCVSEVPPAVIDINMGCPVRKIVSNGEGSALMKNIPLAADIVRAMTAAVKLPVTVKIRAGWDKDSINAVEMARALEDAGAAMICVHARTREQMYEPRADWSVIADVKAAVKIPVFGNGDIFSAEDAERMKTLTGCDGVMVARGAMGNPWIFSEIIARREGVEYIPPTVKERFATAERQIEEMVREKGERIGIAEAKKHLAWYCKGIEGAAAARAEIMKAEDLNGIKEIINELSKREYKL